MGCIFASLFNAPDSILSSSFPSAILYNPNISLFFLKYSSVSLHLLQAISLPLTGGGK